MSRRSYGLTLAGVSLALAGSLAFTGCTGEEEPAPAETTTPAEVEPTETAEASTPTGDLPEWAINPIDVGEQVAEGTSDSWDMKVFQLGNAETVTDGTWAMPDSNEPVMPAGTEVTVYNFVFTNTSDNEIALADPSSAVMIMHGGVEDYKEVLGSPDEEVYEAWGVSDWAYDYMNTDEFPKYGDETVFIVGPGQSFAVADNTWATAGPIEVSASMNVTGTDGTRMVNESEIIDAAFEQ